MWASMKFLPIFQTGSLGHSQNSRMLITFFRSEAVAKNRT